MSNLEKQFFNDTGIVSTNGDEYIKWLEAKIEGNSLSCTDCIYSHFPSDRCGKCVRQAAFLCERIDMYCGTQLYS